MSKPPHSIPMLATATAVVTLLAACSGAASTEPENGNDTATLAVEPAREGFPLPATTQEEGVARDDQIGGGESTGGASDRPIRTDEIAEAEERAAAGLQPPLDFLQACIAARDFSVAGGPVVVTGSQVSLADFATAMGAEWEQESDGGWILRGSHTDQLRQVTVQIAMSAVRTTNDLPLDQVGDCGPQIAFIRRLSLDGGMSTAGQTASFVRNSVRMLVSRR